MAQMYAVSSFGQETKLDINMKKTSVEEMLRNIELNSTYRFFYRSKDLEGKQSIDLNIKDKSVLEILDAVLPQMDLSYEVFDNYIAVKERANNVSLEKQQIVIKGKVTDVDGNPLPGVNVVEKGTTNGAITNLDGEYTISVSSPDATLSFSYVGFLTEDIELNGQTSIDITLVEDITSLEEVVVIGYGTMKKSDLTGSISTIQGDKITERIASTKLSQALQGIAPGLMVTRSGAGDASVSATIRIRGITTIGDSNPLVIVDGRESSLDWVNPNDVESISVLKDAASAAIYGSRAAAGVILITTKRAKEGQLNMSYDFNYSIEEPTRVASMAGAVDYMKGMNERLWNDGGNIEGQEFGYYSKDMIDSYPELHSNDPYNYPDTDWHSLMLKKTAIQKRHMFSISGGTKHVNSYISINLDDTEGLYMGKGYDRITIRANNDITINDYFSAQIDFNGLYSENTEVHPSKIKNAVVPGIIADPLGVAEWPDGRIAPAKDGENPYAILKHAGNIVTKDNVGGLKAQLNFTPIPDLKFSLAYFAEIRNTKVKNFRKQLTYTGYDDPNTALGYIATCESTRLEEKRNDAISTSLQALSNYTKSLNNHDINVTVGFEENYLFNEYLGAIRDQYELKNFPYLDLGNENYQYNSSRATEYANRSFFGRLAYSYNNKYLFQSNMRYDGSSRFHKNYRWGFFPSFSLGWVISEESFMDNANIDFLKIRASWGSLGNERIGNYPYQSTIGFASTLLFQGSDIVSAQGAGAMNYAIPDISWETTETYDFGVDINFLDNKLNVTADYYKKTTRDMLLALEIPNYIGLNNPDQNTGEMYTTGWELSAGWRDQKGDFRYSINAHLSDFKSIMGDLGGTEFLGSKVKFEGSEFNEWYGYRSGGLFQTQEDVDNSPKLLSTVRPGDIKYFDIDGPDGVPDGIISAANDRTLLGGSLPRYMYGGSINLGYKNFSLNMVFQGVGKQNSLITNEMVYPYQGFQQILFGNSWSNYNTAEQNLNVKYPRFTSTAGSSNNYVFSDYWLFNGAYFRLQDLTISYNLQNVPAKKVKFTNLKLFASVSNLFSIDNYPKGWDPETTSTYWAIRSYTFGIALKF